MEVFFSIDWKLLGARFASLDNEEQAKFFTGFAKELSSWGTHHEREVQISAISNRLGKEIKEILCRYLPSLWYNDAEDER